MSLVAKLLWSRQELGIVNMVGSQTGALDQSGWLDRSCRKEEAVSTWLAETCYIFGDEISDTFIKHVLEEYSHLL